MKKNIVIFVMSPFRNNSFISYSDRNRDFQETCEHTNEVSLKYISWKLKQDNKKIDAVYAFVSEEVQNDLERFKSLFRDYDFDIKAIPLYNNGNLSGSFRSISAMADILQDYINNNQADVCIHIDMTGGPRHAVMLMMALIQMIKFTGAKVGMVTYANILKGKTEGIIEETNEIMNMFTLISGAEEFAAFGNVSQIQKYFASREDISWCLNNVLDAMENLSETIKVCGSYESMKNTLADLAENIRMYEKFYWERKDTLSEQELFFGKLLPTIKNEYAEIMPDNGKSATPIQIIRWCARRSFLQQAVVFYTEWLPDYLIKSKLVEITKKEIIEDCEKAKMEWSSWPIYLFRSYVIPPKKSAQQQVVSIDITSDKLTYEDLQMLLKSNLSANEIKARIKNKNEKFEEFIQNIIQFNKKITWENFAQKVKALSNDDPIKRVLKKTAPTNISFTNYLNRRIKELMSATNVILASVEYSGKALCNELFDLDNVNKKVNTPEEKGENRVKTFEDLLNSNALKSKIPERDLLDFVGQYSEYVNQWRNKFSHAVSNNSNKENNLSITQAIINSVNLIELKE
ncbi:TM1812 family CRISPR-associated protein [Megamonas funiformis]|uniref:TM1812 family CRISPR-associated protein n=1 Tax=Megamonas funiformis TaxID=437897 RepID=UPI00195CA553|nr:TM1812 family CRISPR-associated protein [Megamonas funiformis]MBM6727377.1 hypothetical protein [Megamonas funiformis]